MNVDIRSLERAPPLASAPPRRAERKAAVIRWASVAALLLVFVFLAVDAPGFTTATNLADIVEQSAVPGLLALGLTIVIVAGGGDVITGGIDLSLGATLGLCVALYAVGINAGLADAVAVGMTLAAGLAVGALNGFAVTVLGVLPLLATLAVMNIAAGLELLLTQNTVISAQSGLLTAIGGNARFGLSVTSWVFVAVSALLLVLMHRTPWGLRLHAVGSHRLAARAAGLRTDAYVAASFAGSGLLASIAAILQAARLSGSSPGSGDLLLPVVLTSLLGAVFSRRLLPSIGGTVLGVLFIGALNNGFQLLNVSSYWISGVEGLLILVVVALRSLTVSGRQA